MINHQNIPRFRRYFVVFFLIAIVNCGIQEQTFTVEQREGVSYVHNLAPKWSAKPRVRLDFVQRIGNLGGDDENYHFFGPRNIAVDREKNIYVVDEHNHRVQKFAANGEFLYSFGGQGNGPGELTRPQAITIDVDGKLYVDDAGNHRIQIFDQSGSISNILPRNDSIRKYHLLRNGEIAGQTLGSLLTKTETQGRPLITIYHVNGQVLRDFARARIYDRPLMTASANTTFMDVDDAGNYFVSFYFQNRIEKFSKEGKLLAKISREFDFEEDTITGWKKYRDSNGREFDYKYSNSFSHGIQIDHLGRIWVLSFVRPLTGPEVVKNTIIGENPHVFEIFDSNGILLGKIGDDKLYYGSTFSIFNNHLFISDPKKEMAVFQYKIIEQ